MTIYRGNADFFQKYVIYLKRKLNIVIVCIFGAVVDGDVVGNKPEKASE